MRKIFLLTFMWLVVGCTQDGKPQSVQLQNALEQGNAILMDSEIGALITGRAECAGIDINNRLIEKAEPLVYIGNVPLLGTRHSAQEQKKAMAVLMLMASGDVQLLLKRQQDLAREKEAALAAPAVAAALQAVPTIDQRCASELEERAGVSAQVDAMRSEDEAACNTLQGYSRWFCLAQRRLSEEKIAELEQTASCQPQYTMFKKSLKGLGGDCVMAAVEQQYKSVEEPSITRLTACQLNAEAAMIDETKAIQHGVVGDIDGKLIQLANEMNAMHESAAQAYSVELRNAQLIEKNAETRKVTCSAEVYGVLRDRHNAALKLGAVDYSIQRPNAQDVLIAMSRNYANAEEEQQQILRLVAETESMTQ